MMMRCATAVRKQFRIAKAMWSENLDEEEFRRVGVDESCEGILGMGETVALDGIERQLRGTKVERGVCVLKDGVERDDLDDIGLVESGSVEGKEEESEAEESDEEEDEESGWKERRRLKRLEKRVEKIAKARKEKNNMLRNIARSIE
jgi:hypothetical protein